MKQYTYLLINIFSVIIPLLFSFGKKIKFYRNASALFPALFITGGFFIVWDHFMTSWNVWSFNPEYVMGIYIWKLPLEEWLFFLTIPYSCIFIYESLNALVKRDYFLSISKNISITLTVVLTIVVLFNIGKLYTSVKLLLTVFMLTYVLMQNYSYMGKFYRAYFVSLIPFFIVNGLLTSLPVVIYNDAENTGIRIGTIPVEDTMYMLLLLLMNICLFEFFKRKLSDETKSESKY